MKRLDDWFDRLNPTIQIFLLTITLIFVLFLFLIMYGMSETKSTPTFETTLQAKYGKNVTIESIKKTKYNNKEVTRLLITLSSKDRIIAKGYYVLLDSNNKILKEQKLNDKELTLSLVKTENP